MTTTTSPPALSPANDEFDGPLAANQEQSTRIFMWQNNMCVTYLMIFKKMEDFFINNGCEIVDSAENADWVLVGSCGSFHHEIEAYFTKLEEFKSLGAKIVVYGCLPRITPKGYLSVKNDVEFYINTTKPNEVEKMLSNPKVRWSDLSDPFSFRSQDYRQHDPGRRYVIIQYGCSAGCVFCPHIKGIGPQVSMPKERVLDNIRNFMDVGAKTLFIEARDTGSWGKDLSPSQTFPELLQGILDLEMDFELFINQLGGNWLVRYADELFDILLNPKIVNVHSPVQTNSDRLLKLMGREPGIQKLEAFLKKFRNQSIRPIIRTDMLIGFPTETDEEFERNLDFIVENFDEVACYGYEFHPNTPIAKMDFEYFDTEFVNDRVERAIERIKQNPNIVWHRGGQEPETMVEREEYKKKIGRM